MTGLLGSWSGVRLRARRPLRHLDAGVLLDRLQLTLLLWFDKGDRAARTANAAGAADPVNVNVGRDRHVEVDDVRYRGDVEAAGGYVGRNKDRHAAALEGQHHSVARALRHVAVQRAHVHPLVAKCAEELVAADLRAREDDRLGRLLGGQNLNQLGGLVLLANLELKLLDGVNGQRLRLDLDHLGLIEVAVGELADRRRHRCTEERRLAAAWRAREDLLNVLKETEVEHLVGLIKDDEAAVVENQ